MVKTNDLTDGSRRRFLAGLAGIGASDTLLQWIDRDELKQLTDDPTDEIPIVTHVRHTNHDAFVSSLGSDEPTKLEREPVYERVPYDRWAYIEAVEDAAARVRRRFQGQRLVQVGVESRTNGQHPERVVTVTHTTYRDADGEEHTPPVSPGRVREELPTALTGRAGTEAMGREVEDVPVVFEEAVVEAQAYYDYEYRPVPAGARQEIPSGAISTVGTPATDGWSEVWVTCAHCTGSGSTSMYQNDDTEGDDRYGDVGGSQDRWVDFLDYDAAVVHQAGSGKSVEYDFAANTDGWWGDGEYWGYPIRGIMAWDRIKYNLGNTSFDVYLQGQTTGRNAGHVVKLDEPAYEIAVDSDDGDSGGPYFEIVSGDAYIGGIHAWQGTVGDDYARGTSMEHIEDHFGISV